MPIINGCAFLGFIAGVVVTVTLGLVYLFLDEVVSGTKDRSDE